MRSSILLASVCIFLLGPSAIRPAFAAEAYWRCAVGRVVVVTNSSGARCERLLRAALRASGRAEVFQRLAGSLVADPSALMQLGWAPPVTTADALAALGAAGRRRDGE